PTSPTTEPYSLPLHDPLPIYDLIHGSARRPPYPWRCPATGRLLLAETLCELVELFAYAEAQHKAQLVPVHLDLLIERRRPRSPGDRKSTRLNSSHVAISYAVF